MLPAIERHARGAFRGFGAEAKEEAVTEVVASAMCAYRRLHERGEPQRAFPSVLARFAIAQFHAGRRVGAPQRSSDLYVRCARVDSPCGLGPQVSAAPGKGSWRESLVDNRRTSVPAQVAFRLDFPRWLDRLPRRDRRAAERLSLGYSTREVARELRVTPGRVSQLRRELAQSWFAFTRGSVENSRREALIERETIVDPVALG